MTINPEEKFEQIINEAMNLREQGKSAAEILKLFPENQLALQEIFRAIEFLDQQKNEFAPDESLLRKVLSNKMW